MNKESKNISDVLDVNTAPSSKAAPATISIVTGSSSFKDILKSSAFVDKTMLVKDIVDSADKVLLITCPRRFGKSTNMDMIKTFLEIAIDKDENKYTDKTTTSNYKLFQGHLEAPLHIAQDESFQNKYDQCQGQYPVIFVDFLNAKGLSYKEILDGVKLAINKAFKQHEYMIDVLDNLSKNNELPRSQKKKAAESLTKFERLYDKNGQEATDIDIKDSLRFLSEVLHTHFAQKVYVLIDEYDAPIHSATQNNLEVNKINSFIDGILCSVFKGNDDHLEKGLMTGISGMVRASASSGLNNVATYKFLDNHIFSKYYGFTGDEVSKLLDKFSVQNKQEVKIWYNGYLVEGGGLDIYNPWSIVKHIKNNKLDNYWEKSGTINNILKIFAIDGIRNTISKLIEGQELQLSLKTDITLNDLNNLQQLLNCKDEIPQQHIDLFFSYIFELGYLSFTHNKNNYKIPNKEIKSEFTKNIVDYYLDTYKLKREDFNNAIHELDKLLKDTTTIDTNNFKVALDKLFKQLPLAGINVAKKDGVQPNEDLFHSIINIIALQSNANKFGTEVWHKHEARADIILINDETKLGMIIEMKYDNSAGVALTQTEKYIPIFEEHKHIKTIKSLGINVSRDKRVDISSELKSNPNYSGQGTNTENDIYDLPYHKSFNKYYSDHFEKILKLRVKDLNLGNNIKILPAKYQLSQMNTGIDQMIEEAIALNLKNQDVILVPYNIENKHWVGLVITKNNNILQINYLDSENKAIPENLLLALESKNNELHSNIKISQVIVEQQEFNNCGPEAIENMVLLLTGDRINPQEDVVPFHSQLIEDNLLGLSSYDSGHLD